MKRYAVIVILLSLLAGILPVSALGASGEDDLTNVAFHDSALDGEMKQILRDGVSYLWAAVKPYAQKYGVDEFPRSDIWGFPDRSYVARYCGNVSGCAYPGRAYIGMAVPMSIPISAHETMHLVQYAISGSDVGSYCISEGAAEWYANKAVESHPAHPVSFKIVMDSAQSSIAGEDNPPFPLQLVTENQFKGTDSTIAYPVCLVAFDLLMQVEGGEEQGSRAYFRYLFELSRTDWKTAFDRAFSDDVETFEKRFAMYRESWFTETRFEYEIENERFIRELLDCEPTKFAVCIT